jgi:hypothetical protein
MQPHAGHRFIHGGSDGAARWLTAFRIRFILMLDEALESALPAGAPRLAAILKLRARHAAYAAHLVNWVEGMPAGGEPI